MNETITGVAALLVSLGALLYVILPLVRSQSEPFPVEDDRLTELISRKDSLLVAIKDLEFDYQVGKISQEDYERFNQRLRRQAIGYIQQIEKVAPEVSAWDTEVETEIARLRRRPPEATTSEPANLEPASSPVENENGALTVRRFCTNCGQALGLGHKFCGSCGTPVEEEALAVDS